MPSEVLQGKTPYELLYRKPPSVDHLGVSGFLCYATNLVKNDKFGARARAVVFLRDVVFKEQLFPFSQSEPAPTPFTPVTTPLHLPLGPVDVVHDKVVDAHDETVINDAVDVANDEAVDAHDADINIQDAQDTDAIDIVADASNNDNVTHETLENVDCISQEVQVADNTMDSESELRRSGRTSKPPLWHQDYVTRKHAHTTIYSLSNYVFYVNLSAQYRSFLTKFSLDTEPQNFQEASKDDRWVKDMKQEIKALEENNTWEIVDLPNGKNVIGSK
ncbi:uncharacterized protein LOC142163403 [Nicotiana tabacum]|uniref:Uncharacterized protein LOC142163403 n=1 Tax=Nicotiana tabacum TaxID=4097 RepID=A0AC58RVL9_TOBAC